MQILILGASYGSLLASKCLMAGHNVTLVCRTSTAKIINALGTNVEIRLKGQDQHRNFASNDLPGRLFACTPDQVDPSQYDFAVLAMQEPQYSNQSIWRLLISIAKLDIPCLSLMNMPPLAYLKRIPGIDASAVESAFTNERVWDEFKPHLISRSSPDPQAVRPAGFPPNHLLVGLATNFKAAEFGCEKANAKLHALAKSIEEVRIIGCDIPVKLRPHTSTFVPFAKWSMLLTGNYRCISNGEPISICDAVHSDIETSRSVYEAVAEIVVRLGASPDDLVPFEKYAKAALCLSNPSSAARALANGSTAIERVDQLVQTIGQQVGVTHPEIGTTVTRVNRALTNNTSQAA